MLMGYGYSLEFDGYRDEAVIRMLSDPELIPEGLERPVELGNGQVP